MGVLLIFDYFPVVHFLKGELRAPWRLPSVGGEEMIRISLLLATLVLLILVGIGILFTPATPFVRVETEAESGYMSLAQKVNQRSAQGWVVDHETKNKVTDVEYVTIFFVRKTPWYLDPGLPWNRR